MNLELDETQVLLRDTVREFLSAEVPFDRIRELEREQHWDAALWKDVCHQGFLGLPFEEGLGGAGGTLLDVGILVEEFARRAAIVPIVETLVCGRVMAHHAPAERAAALIAALLDGSFVPVPAILEAGDRYGEIGVVVSGSGELRGEKRFVDYGTDATHHLVSAAGAEGPGLYLVDARADGITARPLHSIGRTPSALVTYDGVAAERIADREALPDLIRLGRALAAVQCVGSAQQALDMTVRYASVREQFGRPIGTFQAVKHHCANMAIRVASARFLVFEALEALDQNRATAAQVALAKASASRMVPDVTMLAHQIHGGNGVIEENDLYFFTLRGKERSLAWGSVDECLAIASGSVEGPHEWLC